MKPLFIIVHGSGTFDSKTLSWGAIRRIHKEKGYIDVGYHAGIEQARFGYQEILLGRLWDQEGAHCRAQQMNHQSLGLCLVGNFDVDVPPQDQWNLAVNLVKFWCRQYRIPVNNVMGHGEIDNRKSCPGKLFDMDTFRADVKRGELLCLCQS